LVLQDIFYDFIFQYDNKSLILVKELEHTIKCSLS
jgi:hypothetical protein